MSTQLQALETKIDGLEEVPETTRRSLTDRVRQIEESLDGLQGERVPDTEPRLSIPAKLLEKIRQLRSGTGNFPGIEGPSAAPTDAQAEWLGRFDTQLNEVENNLERLVSVTDRRAQSEARGSRGGRLSQHPNRNASSQIVGTRRSGSRIRCGRCCIASVGEEARFNETAFLPGKPQASRFLRQSRSLFWTVSALPAAAW